MLKTLNLIFVFISFSILPKAQNVELIAKSNNHVKGEIIFQLAENQSFTDFKKMIIAQFEGLEQVFFTPAFYLPHPIRQTPMLVIDRSGSGPDPLIATY